MMSDERFCPIHLYRCNCSKECACYSLKSCAQLISVDPMALCEPPGFIEDDPGNEALRKRPYCNHLGCFISEKNGADDE